MLRNSTIQPFVFEGVRFWLKRDDLLDEAIDGNKARKFYSLLNYDLNQIDTLVSFGGNQSNAMYSLSALAKRKNIKFRYYTKKLSKQAEILQGNLKYGIQNGMELVEIGAKEYEELSLGIYEKRKNELFIPQGGACELSREGIHILADELNLFAKEKKIQNPKLILSSGTGTSAAYLLERFEGEVITTACVGSHEYLREQIAKLTTTHNRPTMLSTNKKYHFAKLHIDIWNMYQKLLTSGVEFDLLYDCVTWIAISENISRFADGETIFVHSGGVRGNETQIQRYNRKLFGV